MGSMGQSVGHPDASLNPEELALEGFDAGGVPGERGVGARIVASGSGDIVAKPSSMPSLFSGECSHAVRPLGETDSVPLIPEVPTLRLLPQPVPLSGMRASVYAVCVQYVCSQHQRCTTNGAMQGAHAAP